jgi:DNA invertase Pin-like site-specific DNA recombinase
MKVIGNIRVSTEEQAKDGKSLDAQRAKLTAYAALYDLELVDITVDAGVSAKSLDRDGLQTALGMLKKGEVQGLLIAKLDRLSRNVGDWQFLIDNYFGEKPGKTLFSVADSIDTRTAAGRMVLNILISVSQWEREVIAERTRDTLQYKIKQGERCGKVRYGFDLDNDGIHLVANGAEQKVIGLMKQMRAEGASYGFIANELDVNGIPTKDGGKWAAMTVRAYPTSLKNLQTTSEM